MNHELKLINDINKMLVMYGKNGSCIIIKFKKDIEIIEKKLYIKNLHKSEITNAYISPDGNYLSTTSLDGKFAIWKVEYTEELILSLKNQIELIPFKNEKIKFHHWCDTRILSCKNEFLYWSYVVIVSENNELKLYNVKTHECLQTLK